jgi:hypothetical protein
VPFLQSVLSPVESKTIDFSILKEVNHFCHCISTLLLASSAVARIASPTASEPPFSAFPVLSPSTADYANAHSLALEKTIHLWRCISTNASGPTSSSGLSVVARTASRISSKPPFSASPVLSPSITDHKNARNGIRLCRCIPPVPRGPLLLASSAVARIFLVQLLTRLSPLLQYSLHQPRIMEMLTRWLQPKEKETRKEKERTKKKENKKKCSPLPLHLHQCLGAHFLLRPFLPLPAVLLVQLLEPSLLLLDVDFGHRNGQVVLEVGHNRVPKVREIAED